MDNLQDIFSSVLSNPEAVNKLRSLGKELGLTGNTDNTSTEKKTTTQENSAPFDVSALSSLLSSGGSNPQPNPMQNLTNSLSPEAMQSIAKLMPLLSGFSQEDETTALLQALRPFLSGSKRKRLDDAGKMLRVMRILPMLRSTGIF